MTPGTNLSRVSNPGTVATTRSSVPELSPAGNDTGRSIAGAVTLELTDAQVSAANSHKLWVQGGTATEPLGPVKGQYGFASLRCANDNLNGDNVEFISFTTNQRNVFCYTYLVKPPPKAGVIVIKKAVPDRHRPDITFGFGGNVSFNPGGAFSLAQGPVDRVRPRRERRHRIRLEGHRGRPQGLEPARSPASPPRARPATQDLGDNGVSIDLAAGDTVTCTFVNSPNPPPNRLKIGKFAKGGSGRVRLQGDRPRRHGDRQPDSRRTQGGARPHRLVRADEGRHLHRHRDPADSPKGVWALTAMICDGAVGAVVNATTATIDVKDPSASGALCALVNTFDSNAASLTIRSSTVGGAGGENSYKITSDSVLGIKPGRRPPPERRQHRRRHVRDGAAGHAR